jgi:hypothetical protein
MFKLGFALKMNILMNDYDFIYITLLFSLPGLLNVFE